MNHQIYVEVLARLIFSNRIFMAVLFLLKFTECYLNNNWRKTYSRIYMALFQCCSSGANLTISQFGHVVGCTILKPTMFEWLLLAWLSY